MLDSRWCQSVRSKIHPYASLLDWTINHFQSDTGELGDKTTTEYQVDFIGNVDEPGLEVILVQSQEIVIANENGDFTFTSVAMPSAGEGLYNAIARDIAGNQGNQQNIFIREGINGAPIIWYMLRSNFACANCLSVNIFLFSVTVVTKCYISLILFLSNSFTSIK